MLANGARDIASRPTERPSRPVTPRAAPAANPLHRHEDRGGGLFLQPSSASLAEHSACFWVDHTSHFRQTVATCNCRRLQRRSAPTLYPLASSVARHWLPSPTIAFRRVEFLAEKQAGIVKWLDWNNILGSNCAPHGLRRDCTRRGQTNVGGWAVRLCMRQVD